uniref:DNA-directed RNA polymerases I and III subunit RPAC1 n=1 Tax=Ananas comosus var. bracteatus TaxID=296719 RepID=A0A6V7Q8H6_ANACO|nr:unnamed protein product [Ananas comosus var. bracteatus]
MPKVSALDMEDVPKGKLPEHLELQRTRVVCKADAPIHTEGIQYSGAYASMGVDNNLRMDNLCKNFKIEIKRLTEDEVEFDMIGIDASIANAFRRILIAEVPTMAIEKVFMVDNTSVIADEVLAHRLGLIPLDADPRQFEYFSENDVPNERNTIVYELKVSCKRVLHGLQVVKSDQLKWLPDGSQLHKETPSQSAEPKTYTSFNIILAKLGPGQAIELEAHAVKGIGKDHAKWSPVATAWYRMLPEVVFLKEVTGADAEELVKKCPVNVLILKASEMVRKSSSSKTTSLHPLQRMHPGVTEEAVELRRVKDHFIFTIESTGALPPEVLFTEAVKILEEKCNRLITELS